MLQSRSKKQALCTKLLAMRHPEPLSYAQIQVLMLSLLETPTDRGYIVCLAGRLRKEGVDVPEKRPIHSSNQVDSSKYNNISDKNGVFLAARPLLMQKSPVLDYRQVQEELRARGHDISLSYVRYLNARLKEVCQVPVRPRLRAGS